ncbi:MAG: DUF2330 domain-containing protein, partial [Sciscionella sp.]|nr:DUF2330 domain-containing protein [Sciscionella sp.]
AGGGKTLQGELPPLTVAFDTTSPVYPMKLSALAEHPQSLRLYVLAAHKVSVAGPAPSTGDLTLSFAGRNDDSAYPHIPDIGGRPAFVTRYDGQWSTPSVITDDVHMTPTASDATYRQTVIEYVNDDGTDTPHSAQANGSAIAAWSAVGGVGVLLIAALWVLINRRRTRPADRR